MKGLSKRGTGNKVSDGHTHHPECSVQVRWFKVPM